MASIQKRGEHSFRVRDKASGTWVTRTFKTEREAETFKLWLETTQMVAKARTVVNRAGRGAAVDAAVRRADVLDATLHRAHDAVSGPTLKQILIKYREEVAPRKRGAAQEISRLNAFIQQPI